MSKNFFSKREKQVIRRENRLRSYEKHHKLTLNLNLKKTVIPIYLKFIWNLGMLLDNTKSNLQNVTIKNNSLSNNDMKHGDVRIENLLRSVLIIVTYY